MILLSHFIIQLMHTT